MIGSCGAVESRGLWVLRRSGAEEVVAEVGGGHQACCEWITLGHEYVVARVRRPECVDQGGLPRQAVLPAEKLPVGSVGPQGAGVQARQSQGAVAVVDDPQVLALP